MAILDQSKLPVMHKQNSDSSEGPGGISTRGVNADPKLVSCTGKGGPSDTWPPTTHARKTTTKQPNTHVKTMEKVTFSCQDIREKGLLRNDNSKEVMNIHV